MQIFTRSLHQIDVDECNKKARTRARVRARVRVHLSDVCMCACTRVRTARTRVQRENISEKSSVNQTICYVSDETMKRTLRKYACNLILKCIYEIHTSSVSNLKSQ